MDKQGINFSCPVQTATFYSMQYSETLVENTENVQSLIVRTLGSYRKVCAILFEHLECPRLENHSTGHLSMKTHSFLTFGLWQKLVANNGSTVKVVS